MALLTLKVIHINYMAQVFINGKWQESQPLPAATQVGLANNASTFGGTALNPTQLAQSSAPQASAPTIARTSAPATPVPIQSTPIPNQQPSSTATPTPAQITVQPSNPSTTTPTYSGLIGSLANTSTVGNPAVPGIVNQITTASNTNPLTSGPLAANYNTSLNEYNTLKQKIAAEYAAIGSEAIPLGFQQGRAQVLAQQYAAQLDAAAQKVAAAQTAMSQGITEQGQQISGLNSAGGLSNTSQQLSQSGLTSAAGLAAPILGQPGQTNYGIGGSSAGGTDAASLVSGWAQYLAQGGDPSQVPATISSNSQLWLQTLNAAKTINPSFDVNTATGLAAGKNASATQTGTIGGTLTKSADSAKAALDKLVSDYGNLSFWQSHGIPLTNDIAQSLGSAFGSSGVSAYDTTLNDARGQLAGVLTATGAVTPTGADAMARSYLPDGMTPSQLAAKIAAAKTLIDQKVTAFTSSSNTNANSTNSSGWF